jgi:hypothetical protein
LENGFQENQINRIAQLSAFSVLVTLIGSGIIARFREFFSQRSFWLDEVMLSLNVLDRSYTELLFGENPMMAQMHLLLFIY